MSSPADNELISVTFNCTGGQARIQARFITATMLDANWVMLDAELIPAPSAETPTGKLYQAVKPLHERSLNP